LSQIRPLRDADENGRYTSSTGRTGARCQISCTIIVTDANALTRPIHHRMPVVLDKADIVPWLPKPAAKDRLRMWPVSRRINKTGTGDDDPTLIDEVAA